jgi:hypothetical protein
LLPLPDAVVIWISDSRMTPTGFERDELTRRSVAQSSFVEIPQDIQLTFTEKQLYPHAPVAV